jgi:hypothetical protein
MKQGNDIEIKSRDYWFKVVDFLQQNWALIDPTKDGVVVWFFGDTAGVFEELYFETEAAAFLALKRDGFKQFADNREAQKFIAIPEGSFRWYGHPNGPIYSSGRFWI